MRHALGHVRALGQCGGVGGEFGVFEEHHYQSVLAGDALQVGQLSAEGVFGEKVGEEHHQCVARRARGENRGQLREVAFGIARFEVIELLENEPQLLGAFARRHHHRRVVSEGHETGQVIVVHRRERKLQGGVDGVVHQGHIVEASLHVPTVIHHGVDHLRAFVVEMVHHHLLAASSGFPVDASEIVAADELTNFLKLGRIAHGANQAFAHLHVVLQAILRFAFTELSKFRIDLCLGAATNEQAALPQSEHSACKDIEVAEGEVPASVGAELIGEFHRFARAHPGVVFGKHRGGHVFRQFVEGKNARREPRGVAHNEANGVVRPDAQARVGLSPPFTLE